MLRTSVGCWGEVHFETFYLAPKNLLVRFIYGPQEKPIQTETYWTNGAEFYIHTSGTAEKCEKVKEEVDFFAFGLGTLFEFDVPMLLMPEAQKYGGKFTQPFDVSEVKNAKSDFVLRKESDFGKEFYKSVYETVIDATNLRLKSAKTSETYSASAHPTLAAPIKSTMVGPANAFTPKLLLLFGKANVFAMEPISTECTYDEVHFDEKIPEALFSFRPAAGAL